MTRETALILVEVIITRYKDIDDETGIEVSRLIAEALPPKAEEK